METFIKTEKLESIIDYLKSDPQIKYNPYPEYEVRIYELLDSLGIECDYMIKHNMIENKSIQEMSLDDLRVMYTFMLRGERFCDGYIASCIENKTLLYLAQRELELLNQK